MLSKINISPTLCGAVFCAVVYLFGPLYTVEGYSVISHTASELGAQKTRFAWLMNWGLMGLGVGAGFDAWIRFKETKVQGALFILFGAAMFLLGFYQLRPLDPELKFDADADLYHGWLVMITSGLFALGALAFTLIEEGKKRKALCINAALGVAALGVLMAQVPDYAGLLQRLLFVIIMVWLVAFLPDEKIERAEEPM